MVDERFDDAMKDAKEADELIKSGKYTEDELAEQKPFLGVPISTKDCIAVKGKHWKQGVKSNGILGINPTKTELVYFFKRKYKTGYYKEFYFARNLE